MAYIRDFYGQIIYKIDRNEIRDFYGSIKYY